MGEEQEDIPVFKYEPRRRRRGESFRRGERRGSDHEKTTRRDGYASDREKTTRRDGHVSDREKTAQRAHQYQVHPDAKKKIRKLKKDDLFGRVGKFSRGEKSESVREGRREKYGKRDKKKR